MVGGQSIKTKYSPLDVSPTLEIQPGSAFKNKANM
jgi:hypothetical protein